MRIQAKKRYLVPALAIAAALATPSSVVADPPEPRPLNPEPNTIDLRYQADVTLDGGLDVLSEYYPGDMIGQTVGGGGDVNGDGIDDLVIAAPHSDLTGDMFKDIEAGLVYVVFGRRWPSGTQIDLGEIGGPLPDRLAGFRIDGGRRGASLGLGTATIAGDVNGDGLDDVIVNGGGTYVIFGSTSANTVDLGEPLGERGFAIAGAYGWSAVGAGDINGDRLADVVVGGACPAGSGLGVNCRYVVLGSAGSDSTATVDLGNPQGRAYAIGSSKPADHMYEGLAGGGDINGDGWPDIVSGFYRSGSYKGAYAVFGTPSTDTVDLADPGGRGFPMTIPGPTETGYWLAFAGNVDGKRGDDVILGGREAATYVVYGTASTAPVDLLALGDRGIELKAAPAGESAGRSVDGAGDVNGDGFDDVIVGADRAGHRGRRNSGSAYIVFGGSGEERIDLADLDHFGVRIDGAEVNDGTGSGVAGVGDINGDGFDDVLIGAPQLIPGETSHPLSGVAYVVYGRPWRSEAPIAKLKQRDAVPRP